MLFLTRSELDGTLFTLVMRPNWQDRLSQCTNSGRKGHSADGYGHNPKGRIPFELQ